MRIESNQNDLTFCYWHFMNFMIANWRNFAPRLTPTPIQPTNHHYHCIWSNCRDADIKRHRFWNYNLSTEPDHEVGISTTTWMKTAITYKMVVCMHVDISRDTFHVLIWRMNNVPNRYNILQKTAPSWTCEKTRLYRTSLRNRNLITIC